MDCQHCNSPQTYFDGRKDHDPFEEIAETPNSEWETKIREYQDILESLKGCDITDEDELREAHIRLESEKITQIQQELRKLLLVLQNETGTTIYDGYPFGKSVPLLRREDKHKVIVEYDDEYTVIDESRANEKPCPIAEDVDS